MIANKFSQESITVPAYSRCRGARLLSSNSSVMPTMAFKGVRISWLMLARKLLLARLAASTASICPWIVSWASVN